MKNKKPLYISLISLDVLVTIVLFVFSIIKLAYANKTDAQIAALKGFVGWLVRLNPWVYGFSFVVPLFVLLAVNIVVLVIYVKKTAKKDVKVNDLTDAQKEALRQELLKDLQGGGTQEAPKEEPKVEVEEKSEPTEEK